MKKIIIILLTIMSISAVSAQTTTRVINYGIRLKAAQGLAQVTDSTAAKIIGITPEQYDMLINNRLTFASKDEMEAAIYALKRKRKNVNTF
jgi:nucleoside recognition membrane protein YjiH